MGKKDGRKNDIVLYEKGFLLPALAGSVILLFLSLIYWNPLLAMCVLTGWLMIGVTHLTNYFSYGKSSKKR